VSEVCLLLPALFPDSSAAPPAAVAVLCARIMQLVIHNPTKALFAFIKNFYVVQGSYIPGKLLEI